MTTIMVGIQGSVLVFKSSNSYKVHEALKGTNPQRIVFDPLKPDHAYCATFGDGLWKTDDGGYNWNNIGKGVITSCLSQLVHPIVGRGCIEYMPEQSLVLFIFQMTRVNLGKRWKP